MRELLRTFVRNLRSRWRERFGPRVDAVHGDSVVERFRELKD